MVKLRLYRKFRTCLEPRIAVIVSNNKFPGAAHTHTTRHTFDKFIIIPPGSIRPYIATVPYTSSFARSPIHHGATVTTSRPLVPNLGTYIKPKHRFSCSNSRCSVAIFSFSHFQSGSNQAGIYTLEFAKPSNHLISAYLVHWTSMLSWIDVDLLWSYG